MSDIVKTVLWHGKHIDLVKRSGYTSYSGGSHHYTPGEIRIEEHNHQYGRTTTTVHHLDIAPAPSETEAWKIKGITWGRLTKAILARLIVVAEAADALIPAQRKAEREAAEAKGREQREAAARRLERYGHRAAFAVKMQGIAKELYSRNEDSHRAARLGRVALDVMELARGFLEIADFKLCGGRCGRELPSAMFGFCCGARVERDASCGAPICLACTETAEGLGLRDNGCLVCAKHGDAARERGLKKKEGVVK